MVYLWVKDDAERQLQILKHQKLVGDLLVQIDRSSGKKYISTYTELSDPTSEIAKALGDLTEKVTARERIHRGLRPEGVYRYNGATLIAKTTVDGLSDSSQDTYQWLKISGPTIEAVENIYSLFRQGKLVPEESWEECIPSTPASATETKKKDAREAST